MSPASPMNPPQFPPTLPIRL